MVDAGNQDEARDETGSEGHRVHAGDQEDTMNETGSKDDGGDGGQEGRKASAREIVAPGHDSSSAGSNGCGWWFGMRSYDRCKRFFIPLWWWLTNYPPGYV